MRIVAGVADHSATPSVSDDNALQAMINQRAAHPMPLTSGTPLCRFELLTIDDDRSAYNGESLTPEPLLEYADYMEYQEEWRQSDAYQDAMRYWQNTGGDVADS